MQHTFTAVFDRDGDWWIGYVEELPGANTQGRTVDEATENLKEAIQLILDARREEDESELEGQSVIRRSLSVPVA
jgi:predicted RNase H-like HicB family nuclease